MGNSPFCSRACLKKDDRSRPVDVNVVEQGNDTREFSRGTPSEVVPLVNKYDEEFRETPKKTTGSCCRRLCCCFCCLLFLVALSLYAVIPFYLGHVVGAEHFLKLSPLVNEYIFDGLDPGTIPEYIWWPGCTEIGNKNVSYLESCATPCYSPELIPAIEMFNKANPFKQVTYYSRPDTSGKTYRLTGWLLPGEMTNLPANTKAPRVVINHGFTSNSNKWYPTLAAYYLRSMGFDVLLNNMRDHGYSQNTSNRVVTWGYSYHYDLLGAWDYLRKDPDGILGGELDASQVGLMGFSLGAFVTLNAFLLEAEIPAAWADSPPASPRDVFNYGARQMTLPKILFKIPGIEPLTWFWLKHAAHADISARVPLEDIPNGPEGERPLQIVHNAPDKTVPLAGAKEIVEAARKYPTKYDVKEPYYTDATCNEETHIVTALLEPTPYREKLCTFWTTAFNVSSSLCGLEQLSEFKVYNISAGSPAVSASIGSATTRKLGLLV